MLLKLLPKTRPVQSMPGGPTQCVGVDGATSSCRLLILDDDPVIALTMQLTAESAGAGVRVTSDPLAFFAELENWQPTHVCTDLLMSGMDGMQVLAELARLGCNARVIISSGVGPRVLDAAARSAVEHGLVVIGVLPKPFAPAALRALLALGQGALVDGSCSPPAKVIASPAAALPFVPDLAALEQALAQGQLHVVYQPKVHCDTGRLCGLEALVRWRHPQHGNIGPDQFIPLAERAGRIDELTLQVLDQALSWFVPWRRADPTRDALTLSINLSARSLGSPYLVSSIHERCCEAGLSPSHLMFELTETAAMDDPLLALELLTRMRVQGFQLSIDDFGTGFSSMVQLVRLPFTEIKVDRSFVMNAGTSAESRAVIRSIVDLGHSLGLRVTAEGVEDQDALDYLRTLGCDEAQGYFIARPLPPSDLDAWVRQRPGPREVERLHALHALNLLNSPPEPRFDRLTALARAALHMPMAMLNLVADRLQWTQSANGLAMPDRPAEASICAHVVDVDGPFVVADLAADPRFDRHPMVSALPGLRFYAGCALRIRQGPTLGVLCVLDTQVRAFGARECELLQGLAKLAEIELGADRRAMVEVQTGLLNAAAFEERAAASLAWALSAGMVASLVLIEPQASLRSAVAGLLQVAFGATALVTAYHDDRLIVLSIGAHSSVMAVEEGMAWIELGLSMGLDTGCPGAAPLLRWGSATVTPGDRFDLQGLLTLADARLNASQALYDESAPQDLLAGPRLQGDRSRPRCVDSAFSMARE